MHTNISSLGLKSYIPAVKSFGQQVPLREHLKPKALNQFSTAGLLVKASAACHYLPQYVQLSRTDCFNHYQICSITFKLSLF